MDSGIQELILSSVGSGIQELNLSSVGSGIQELVLSSVGSEINSSRHAYICIAVTLYQPKL